MPARMTQLENRVVRIFDSSVLVGRFTLVSATLFLVFVFSPSVGHFQVHDFLDHVVTLNSIWARYSLPFDYESPLPYILGGNVTSGMLGMSDLSPLKFIFWTFSPEVAVWISESLARTLAMLGLFGSIRLLLHEEKNYPFPAVAGSIAYALMPYYPSMSWIMATFALTLFAVLRFNSSQNVIAPMALIVISAQFGNVAWGGFLSPLIVVLGLTLSFLQRRKVELVALKVLSSIVGIAIASAGLIWTIFVTDFESHRAEFGSSSEIESNKVGLFLDGLPSAFTDGTYHYSAGNSGVFWGSPILFPLLLLAMVLFARRRGTSYEVGAIPNRTLLALLGLQALIAIWYQLDVSGIFSLAGLLDIPFQTNRLIAMAPLLWALILSFAMFGLSRWLSRPLLAALSLAIVVILGGLNNTQIRSSLERTFGFENDSKVATVVDYMDKDRYQTIWGQLPLELRKSKFVSLGPDPMVASMNGFNSADGYVYNYPRKYKQAFRQIIAFELSKPEGRLSYFDDWGSRVYLFPRDVEETDYEYDWCAAQRIGVKAIISDRNLSDVEWASLVVEHEGLRVYRIVANCP